MIFGLSLLFLVSCPSLEEVKKRINHSEWQRALRESVCFEDLDPQDERWLYRLRLLNWTGHRERAQILLNRTPLKQLNFDFDTRRSIEKMRSSFKLRALYGFSRLNQDRNQQEGSTTLSYQFGSGHQIGLGYQNSARQYPGASSLMDHSFEFYQTHSMTPWAYVEWLEQWSPTSKFLPKWSMAGSPHVIFGVLDLGLGIKYLHYSNQNSWLFRLNASVDLPSDFRIYLGSDALIYPQTATSVTLRLSKKIQRWMLESGFSGGEADEGDKIVDHFHSYLEKVSFDLSSQWKIDFEGLLYFGGLRDEWKLQSGLEWIF